MTTAAKVLAAIARHRGRGTRYLAELATRYAKLPYHRTRSNPEARALELLRDAGIEPPAVNIKVGGEEADLVWPRQRLLIEIDGPQFHQFSDEDARKDLCWKGAGYTVRRIRSDDVYYSPERLLALAPPANVQIAGS